MRRVAWLPLAFAAAPAWAHDLPQTFAESLTFLPGPFILPLLSLGMMLAVSGRLRLLAGAVLALPLGFVAAPWIGINADLLALGAGLACAFLSTTGLPLAGPGHAVLGLVTALLVGAAMTHGTGWLAMEPAALLGLALGAAGAMAFVPALGLARIAHWPVPRASACASRHRGSPQSAHWRCLSHSRDRFLESRLPRCYLWDKPGAGAFGASHGG